MTKKCRGKCRRPQSLFASSASKIANTTLMLKFATEAFGTITPSSDSCKVGLGADSEKTPIVKAVAKSAIAKWTVQNFDNAPNFYRLFVNDGKKDYALYAPEDNSSILVFEGSPSSSDSHVWYIARFPDGYYYIQDSRTSRAWNLNEEIELAILPAGNVGVDSFKFSFTFSS